MRIFLARLGSAAKTAKTSASTRSLRSEGSMRQLFTLLHAQIIWERMSGISFICAALALSNEKPQELSREYDAEIR